MKSKGVSYRVSLRPNGFRPTIRRARLYRNTGLTTAIFASVSTGEGRSFQRDRLVAEVVGGYFSLAAAHSSRTRSSPVESGGGASAGLKLWSVHTFAPLAS